MKYRNANTVLASLVLGLAACVPAQVGTPDGLTHQPDTHSSSPEPTPSSSPGSTPSPHNITYTVSTIAGNGSSTSSGDGGPATSASFYLRDFTLDRFGNLYIADGNHRVRKVDGNGVISTIAGNGTASSILNGTGTTSKGDEGPALSTVIDNPVSLAVDSLGSVYVSEEYMFRENYGPTWGIGRIRKISNGTLSSFILGSNDSQHFGLGYSGPALNAWIFAGSHIAIDESNSLYVSGHSEIRKFSNDAIALAAGNGKFDWFNDSQHVLGDGTPATSVNLLPGAIHVDEKGCLYIVDDGNSRIRKVSTDGIISTVAGAGLAGGGGAETGDGGLATSAFIHPTDVCADAAGRVYLASSEGKIRVVSPNGILSTIGGYSASLLEVDANGCLYLGSGHKILKLTPNR